MDAREPNKQDLDSNNQAVRSQLQPKTYDSKPLDINPPRVVEVSVKTQADALEGLWRSQRTRRLTEKVQELHDGKCKGLQHCFMSTYC